ncbi:MAG TPA: TlpA disulfide reductase family protein [Caulobacteraceae bacterium]|nr:TlpA disulfide reductase family protein [Caulobacteraceae bacterium]
MTDIHQETTKGLSGRKPWSFALWAGALVAAAVVLYIIVAVVKPGGGAGLQGLAHGEMAKLSTAQKGAPEPATSFLDPQGREVHLADLKAPVLVVNLWATWCAPCVREMPTLAKLQAAYNGRIVVAPISVDKDELRDRARAFIADHAPLVFYQDPKLALPFALTPPAEGFPTTILYGRDGKERARLSGPADWNGPEARAVIDALLAQP